MPEQSVPAPRSLTEKTARGFVYLLAQSVGNLVVGAGQQIALAYLLTKADFGLAGMAIAVTSIAMVLQYGGVREVLIQRHAHFRRWANAAFWLSLAMGLIGGAVLAGLSEVAAWWYETRDVIPLILVMAATMPFISATIVPEARLRGQFRFRAIAAIDFAWLTGIAVLSVVFALMDFGAMSFVLPRLVADPCRVLVMWRLARPPIRWRLHLRRWKYLLPDSLRLLTATFVELGVEVGDYIMLGRFHAEGVVGVYTFAYGLSRRPMAVFHKSVSGVIFPALSTLQNDLRRQVEAFRRAVRLQAMLAVPMGLVGVAIADSAIRAIFPEKWLAAIPVFQLLCLAMTLRVTGWSSRSLIKAQGRFRTYLALGIAYTVIFFTLVTLAAATADEGVAALWTAAAVLTCMTVMEPVYFFAAVRPGGGKWHDMFMLHLRPLLISIVSIAPGWALAQLIPEGIATVHWLRMGVILGVAGVLYPLLARRFMPVLWKDMTGRLKGFLKTR